MGIETIQNTIRANNAEIDSLYAEIRRLNEEMDRVLEAQGQISQKEKDLQNYLSEEKKIVTKIAAEKNVRTAVEYSNSMNTHLSGAKYRAAMSGIEKVKTALSKRRTDIEARIVWCKRRIATLQEAVYKLNLQASNLNKVV